MLCTTAVKLDESVLTARGGGTASTSVDLIRLYDREREILTENADSERSIQEKEEEIQIIDAQILEFEDSQSTDSFVKKEFDRLPRRINEIKEEIIAHRKTIHNNELELPSINEQILKSMGPFRLSIECLLKRLNIKRQSYYGGTFVGNDCHALDRTALRSAVYSNPPNSPFQPAVRLSFPLITNCHSSSPLSSTNSINVIASIRLLDHYVATNYDHSNCDVHRSVIGFRTTFHANP